MSSTILYIANTPAPIDLDTYRKRGMVAVNASNYNFQVMSGFVKNGCKVHTFFVDNQLTDSYSFCDQGVHFHYLKSYISIPLEIIKLKLNPDISLIICDSLHLRGILLGIPFIKLMGIKTVGIVTDLYRFFHIQGTYNLKSYLFKLMGEWTLNFYDSYVLVSEKLLDEPFIKNKPALVAEGIYDSPEINSSMPKKDILLYSGALEPEYGILNAMDAVNKIDNFPFQFHIYSASPSYSEFEKRLNERVIFKGYLSRTDLLVCQREVKALINPRPLDLPFNAYSFPSKLIEYLASGTPTITSNLPSIPDKLKDHLLVVDDTSVSGLEKALRSFIEMPYAFHETRASNAKRIIESEYLSYKISKKIEKLVQ